MSPAHDDPRFLVEPPAPRRERAALPPWTTWLLALLAAAMPAWFHRAFASGDAIVYAGDAAQLQFPRYVTMCEAMQRGEFPLWQTLVYGGSPFHASPENPTLYPPSLLLAAFTDPGWTINGTVLLHLALAGLGMFVLVRRLALRAGLGEPSAAAGALLGATIFAFSHFTRRDHLNLVAYGAAHALIPWMLLAADGLLHGARPRRSAGLLALLVAAIFFTGGLYVIVYAYLALALWMVGLGLLGEREARRRALRLGVWAALVAGLLISAKLVPYREWLPTTNRAGRLTVEEALGTTLGSGPEGFTWSAVWLRTRQFLGGAWVLLPGLLSLALLRHAVVRVAVGLTLLGFVVGLGGTAWRFLYDHVPPFDQVRSAVRAWTLVNAFFPLLAGLGTAWLLQRLTLVRQSGLVAAAAGVLLATTYVPLLTTFDPREALLREPDSLAELRERYPRWGEAAHLAGEWWRVGSLDRTSPEGRNEQFATALLGAETSSGYQGHVWPDRLARHLYGDPGDEPLPRETRLRRLGVLSARWLVETDAAVEPQRDPAETWPAGIEGTVLVDNPHARPRLLLPAAAIGVVGDVDGHLTRALLDHPRFPLADATLVELPARGVSDAELAALDLLLVVAPPQLGDGVVERFRAGLAPQTPVLELPPAAGGFDPELVTSLAQAAAERAARRRTVELGLERDGVNAALLHVLGTGEARGRFALASEPWSWYRGWRVEGLDEEPALRVADGVVSAFLLPAGPLRSPLRARYAPPSTRKGLAFGAVGLVLALGLLVTRGGRL